MQGRPVSQTSISSPYNRVLRNLGYLPEDLNYKFKHKMQKVIDFLDGKKTIIGSIIVFVAGGLLALNLIDQKTFETVVAIGGAIATFGLRSALNKLK